MIRLRFVAGTSYLSRLIRLQGGLCMPFTPSHVECLSQDGNYYIGQHFPDGMMKRPVGYDADSIDVIPMGVETTLKDRKCDIIVELPCTKEQEDAFYARVNARLGAPYDWKSIFDFVNPALNLHDFEHLICSAEMTGNLRTTGCEFFPMPLTVPWHRISPRDLLLMLSSHVQIDH